MKRSICLVFLLVSIKFLHSQDTVDFLSTTNLPNITISATRTAVSHIQLAQSVQSLTRAKIEASMAQSTADLLQKTGSIVVQKSQQGGGSPILRGLEANRVLLVVDGIRMNNIIYRGGHLQNIITVDPNLLERVDVLYGPASSVYGSDALGGVIHMISKSPSFSEEATYKSNINLRYGTVNNESMFHYDGMYGRKNIAALVSATYTKYGDLWSGKKANPLAKGDSLIWPRKNYYVFENNMDVLKTNNEPAKQIASGFNQLDLLTKIKVRPNEKSDHMINVQYSNSSNIPRYDRLTDKDAAPKLLRNGDWYYGPQKRFLASYEANFNTTFPLKFNVNYQSVQESRHNRRVGNYNLQNRIENVSILGFDLFQRQNHGKRSIIYGIDAQLEDVRSTANSTNLITKASVNLDTRYPSGLNKMNRLGGYYIETYNFSPKFSSQGSLRLGYVTLHSDFGKNEFFKFPFSSIKQNNLTYSVNAGLNYNPTPTSKIGFTFATGYRVPNVDDVAKVFESVTGRLVVPNPDLKPEQSASFELNGKIASKNFNSWISGSAYYTNLIDVITIGKFKYNGSDSIIYNSIKSGVFAYQNNSKARISGISFDGQVGITKQMHAFGNIHFVQGKIIKSTGNTPLDHIPPTSGKLGIDYNASSWRLEFATLFNGKKDISDFLLNAEDNEVYATPYGMPAWITYNLYSSFNLFKHTRLLLGIENILDTEYRVFASGINAPGRNFTFSLLSKF